MNFNLFLTKYDPTKELLKQLNDLQVGGYSWNYTGRYFQAQDHLGRTMVNLSHAGAERAIEIASQKGGNIYVE